MAAIERIAARHNVPIVEDCCQAHLATSAGRPVGTIGVAGAFSFYPTKNLGALGDGGAVVTGDAGLAERIRRLRNGGQTSKYLHELAGVNSRLDELQAAILRARLPLLRGWTDRRRALAAEYRRRLAHARVTVPPECDPGHVYHLFVVREKRREALRGHLESRGVETLVHYPAPISSQPALAQTRPAPCPRADAACSEVVSLPLHPSMTDADAAAVAEAVAEFGRKD
jgi:dTDP-4-amino-4,6-dideoxygalactose transaminase